MAEKRKAVPRPIRRALLRATNGRCANPGCPNGRPQLHHIDEYHIYKTHDAKTMIAVCGACHDQIHHGEIKITDETLYAWKSAGKPPRKTNTMHVEPGPAPRLVLGTMILESPTVQGLPILDLSPFFKLSYRLEARDLTLLSLRLGDSAGNTLIEIADNRLRIPAIDPFSYESGTGRHRLLGPIDAVLAPWMLNLLRQEDAAFGLVQPYPLLDVHVTGLAEITVRGVWTDGTRVLVADEAGLRAINGPAAKGIFRYTGGGTVRYVGPVLQTPFLQSVFKIL